MILNWVSKSFQSEHYLVRRVTINLIDSGKKAGDGRSKKVGTESLMLLKKWIKKSRRAICKSLSSRYDKPLAPPTNREKELVKELKTTFRDFQNIKTTNCSPAEKEWLNNVNRFKDLVLNYDPREFLRWDVILRTMSVTHANYLSPELKYLKSRHDWNKRWCEAIQESPAGHPIPHWQYPNSSGNLIHHAYHLAQFEEKAAMRVNNMNCIFEFGGGYGSMCRLFYNLGFQGRYVIFDLPAFSALQEFFLKSIGITIHSLDSFKIAKKGALCISDLEQLKAILSNHIEASDSMFIATWSISEAPMDLRNSILSLTSSFKAFLIGYQDRFGEVNNIDFFKNWAVAHGDIEWHDWQIEHIPNHNRYLVGIEKTDE
jgi:hypothetical protein